MCFNTTNIKQRKYKFDDILTEQISNKESTKLVIYALYSILHFSFQKKN